MRQPGVYQDCSAFHQTWPLFRQRDLKAAGVAHLHEPDRGKLIAAYLKAGAKPAAPECWSRHPASCPLDWPHLLLAAYRVRNNLFHGTKIVDSEMDRALVESATKALRAIVDGPELLE